MTMAIEGGISNINFISLRDEDDDELVGIKTHQDRPIRINQSGSTNQDQARPRNPDDDQEDRDQLSDPTSTSSRYSRNLSSDSQDFITDVAKLRPAGCMRPAKDVLRPL
jgi:hypothetical protein